VTVAALATAPEFSLNLVQDLQQMLQYEFMQHAFEAGTVVAIVAAVTGHFVVLRGLSFAGHALAESGFAGAAGAPLLGLDPLYGMLLFATGSGAAIGVLGRRVYGRDVAIGVVLAFFLGLGALFLTLYKGSGSTRFGILFGDIVGVSSLQVYISLIAGVVIAAAIGFIYRPLLFASLDPEVAEARGVPVRLLSIVFMLIVAVAVSISILAVGVLLIFALLVTPPAASQRFTDRPNRAFWLGVVLALGITWIAIVLAWYIPIAPAFFITTLAFAIYIVARGTQALRRRARRTEAVTVLGAKV